MGRFGGHREPTPGEIDAEVAALADEAMPELTGPQAEGDWDKDPALRRQLADEIVHVLKLSDASRQTLRRYAADLPDEAALARDGAAFRALVEDVLPALRRADLRLELVGLSEDDVRRMASDVIMGSDGAGDAVPDVLMPAKPTGRDRRAIIRAIGEFSPAMRRQVFKTSNMLAIRGMVTAALVMLNRERKNGGLKGVVVSPQAAEQPAAIDLRSASQRPSLGAEPVPSVSTEHRPSLVEEAGRAPKTVTRRHEGARDVTIPTPVVYGLIAAAVVLTVFSLIYLVTLPL